MTIQRIAAFSDGARGGNRAGVMITSTLPAPGEMQHIAAKVGYSETVFAAPLNDGWRVRYFSPEAEIPFCGHATIALGAALSAQYGARVFPLKLNTLDITVEGYRDDSGFGAALVSPPTKSATAPEAVVTEIYKLLGYSSGDLDPRIGVFLINAGAEHLVIGLRSRARLSDMSYDFRLGQELTRRYGLVTIMLVNAESSTLFHARNVFAFGGVYEDPATGAAAAAFAGFLRDIDWPCNGEITIWQGDDMGVPCRIRAEIGADPGSPIRISGNVRTIA